MKPGDQRAYINPSMAEGCYVNDPSEGSHAVRSCACVYINVYIWSKHGHIPGSILLGRPLDALVSEGRTYCQVQGKPYPSRLRGPSDLGQLQIAQGKQGRGSRHLQTQAYHTHRTPKNSGQGSGYVFTGFVFVTSTLSPKQPSKV